MADPEQNGAPAPVEQSWLLRQWERLRSFFWRDVVIGQVEEGAQNVVIGKNIIQIGSLQIPYWLAIVLGITLATIAVATTAGTGVLGGILYTLNQPTATPWPTATPLPTLTPVPTPTPTRMPLPGGSVRIVVADISKQQADGAQVASKLGQELSSQIYTQLTAEYNQHPDLKQVLLGEVTIWSGATLPDALNRPIRWIAGQDAPEREQNARQLADEIGADLLIYGHLTDETPASLVLEFYYRSQPNRLELDGAQGRYQLGAPLLLPSNAESDPTFARLTLGLEMNSRLKRMAWLTVALIYSLLDQHSQALELLRQGEQHLVQTENGAAVDGLDIYYYFVGREALLLYNFAEAETFFNKAKTVNPRSARAYLGLGMLYYDRAQLYYLSLPDQSAPAACVTDETLAVGDKSASEAEADIEQALAAYQQAQTFADETAAYPPIAQVAQLATATAWQLQAQAFSFAGDFATAQTTYAQAATALEALLPAFLTIEYQRFTGATYLSLGQSYHGQGIALWNLAQQSGDSTVADSQRDQAVALLRQAADQYALCMDLGDGTTDNFLKRRIVGCGCTDSQTKVLEDLQTIGGGDG